MLSWRDRHPALLPPPRNCLSLPAVACSVVSVTASSFVWKDYSAGVVDSPACYGNCNTDFFLCTADDVADWSYADHQVTAVGYGTHPVGGDYWLIKV